MNFLECEPKDIPDFVRRQSAAAPLWGFHHLPKTAGSSLVAKLVRDLAPVYNIFANPEEAAGFDYRALLMDQTRKFIAARQETPADRRARIFSGHLFRVHLDLIREAFPETRLFTILRDPVARAISDYRYRLTPAHPANREFARTYPSVIDYVRDYRNQNIMTKMLAPFHHAFNRLGPPLDPREVIAIVLPYYDFIGVAESYEDTVEIAFALMGAKPSGTSERSNVTVSTAENHVDVSDAIVEEIRVANAFDVALHEHVGRLLIPRVAVWRRRSWDDRIGDSSTSTRNASGTSAPSRCPGAEARDEARPTTRKGRPGGGFAEPPEALQRSRNADDAMTQADAGGPLFIFGARRSGTTQMLRLCRDVFGYRGGEEGNLWASVKALDDHFRRLEFELPPSPEDFTLFRLPRSQIVPRYVSMLHEMHVEAYGSPIVDKALGPAFILSAPLIRQALPESRFIFMRRRGIENVLSQMRRFPDFSFETSCLAWARTMKAWRLTRELLGACAIDFDQRDLGVAPEPVASSLTKFLGHGDEEAAARYLATHFPEKSGKGDYFASVSLFATGWDDDQRQTFSDICAEEMMAYGYLLDGEPARGGDAIDFATPPLIWRWSLENGNPWIATSGPGLRLHPNFPGKGIAVLRCPAALAPAEYDFEAEIVVFDARCRPHRLTLSLGAGSNPTELSIRIDGAMQGRVRWSAPKIRISAVATLELSVALDDGLADAAFSATQIVSLAFARSKPE